MIFIEKPTFPTEIQCLSQRKTIFPKENQPGNQRTNQPTNQPDSQTANQQTNGSWRILGRSWAEKRGQHGSNLAPKTDPKSIKIYMTWSSTASGARPPR